MTSCVEAVCYAAVLLETLSHTRTVVRECCKVDDASQWENWKFDPLPRPLNRSSSDMQNVVTIPQGVSFPLRIKMFTWLLSSNAPQPRPPNRFSPEIRQTTWFRARKCLSVLENKDLTLTPRNSQKPPFWAAFV